MEINIKTKYNNSSLMIDHSTRGRERVTWRFGKGQIHPEGVLLIEVERAIEALKGVRKQFLSSRRITAHLNQQTLGG